MATVDQETHLGHIIYIFFRKRLKSVEALLEICVVYGDSVISCERWFTRFRYDSGSLEDNPSSGRPIKTDYGQILSAITSERHISTRQIGKQL